MAQLQYIGARYVPMWYQNSIDQTSNWEINVEYEPLTFVTSQNNHLYLSKKEVPDNIGTPAQNTEYWLDMGVFGGSYEDVEEQIEEINTRIDGIDASIDEMSQDIDNVEGSVSTVSANLSKKEINQQNRKYILIFDSYGGLGISSMAEEACAGGCHVLNVGGAGFAGAGGGSTWGDALSAYLASLTADEKASYTDVMVFGGINDYGMSFNDIQTAMATFRTIVDNNIPQCRVTVAPISFSIRVDTSMSDYCNKVLSAYSTGCTANNFRYCNGLNAWIHNDMYMTANDVHPNASGVTLLGRAVKNFILTETIDKCSSVTRAAVLTPDTGFNLTGAEIFTNITEGHSHVFGHLIVNSSSPFTIQSGYNNAKFICSITDSFFFGTVSDGWADNCATVPAFIHNTGTNTWELRPITIQIYLGRVYITVEGGNVTTDAIQTLEFSIFAPIDRG